MVQPLSIHFQAPEDLTGPTRDLLLLLKNSAKSGHNSLREERVEPVELPATREQELLNLRNLRQRFRRLENERALKTVDGCATWIITDSICFHPHLAERVKSSIVGEGLGTGHIIYGPPEFCLPPGYYIAIIEFQVTSMLGAKRVRTVGEVILNNRRYLSQKTKTISATGSYIFRLPFRVQVSDLPEQLSPAIEVRLDLHEPIGIIVTQVAVVYKAASLSKFFGSPGAHFYSAGNTLARWLEIKMGKIRL